jgi:tetratricopeptide (TPR) repeat protein
MPPRAGDGVVIGRLCRRVQGMPLAIELAAALSGALSVEEIDAEIARSADFLSTSMVNVPERQRSVRTVFEAAWTRLDEDARRAFRRMSVFRGGCTREAAQAVTGASIRTLAALVDKALLWRNAESGRYDIHELLRQYAEAELEAVGEAESARMSHQTYYANFSETWGAAVLRDKQLEALTILDADSENVWLALSRAVRSGIPEEIEPFTDLWMYYDVRSRWKEVEIAFRHACEMLEPYESVALAKLYAGRSIFFAHFDHVQEALETAQRAFEIVQHLNACHVLPMTTIAYADALDIADDIDKAAALYRDAIIIGEKLDQPIWIAPAWFHLGHHARKKGKYNEAKANLTLCYQICASLNNYWGMCFPLRSLGYLSLALSEFDEAQHYFIKALDVARRADFQRQAQAITFGLSAVLREIGDWPTARILAEEAFDSGNRLGTTDAAIFENLTLLAEIKIFLGELDNAAHHLIETVSILRRCQQNLNWNYWFCVTGEYFSRRLDFCRAASLIGAGDRIDPEKKTYTVKELERFNDVVARCRAGLSPKEFEAAWEHGQKMTNEEAVALVAEAL